MDEGGGGCNEALGAGRLGICLHPGFHIHYQVFQPGWVHPSEERKGINPKDMSLERLSSGEILELGTEKARMELMRRLTSQWPEPQ